MFLWIRIDSCRHPRFVGSINTSQVLNHYELLEIEDRVYQKAKEYGVLIGKGKLVRG